MSKSKKPFRERWSIVRAVRRLREEGGGTTARSAFVAAVPRLKALLTGAVALASLIVLFYVVENWRGAWAWKRYKAELESQGTPLTLSALKPPEIPAAEDFAALPFWKDYFDSNDARDRLEDSLGLRSAASLDWLSWKEGRPFDLGEYLVRVRATGESAEGAVLDRREGLRQKIGPMARDAVAREVIERLESVDGPYEELRQASAERPQARFPFPYEDSFRIRFPHLVALKELNRAASLRGVATLAAGDPDRALEETRFALRLVGMPKDEPLLISQLVRGAMFEEALQSVWEGMWHDQWNREQIAAIERELDSVDFLASFERALLGERAMLLDQINLGRKEFRAERNLLLELHLHEGKDLWRSLLIRWAPAGWYNRNKISVVRFFNERAFPLVDAEKDRVYPEKAADDSDPWDRSTPYSFLVADLVPSPEPAAEKFAELENRRRQVRIACAIERYELDHDKLPETLMDLVPQYLEALPHDVLTGDRFAYKRPDPGQYRLYSEGWDQVDHGGTGNDESGQEDWVWLGKHSGAGGDRGGPRR